ncbi:phosphate/phosphite/phosphonate ABC transporter substrate-binding protein [Corynebacterium sp.]|uniref:phosphate/phosphite/phosphonate ABC transporter substrate-binding protein n=1 Tax=Corynebacterium sp. TaxID=1720 RepID=UPI0026DB8F71|nr:phosphate/phosphite/phosphonate ABC transporter substrate-binding protein [Corynebacterium sp.]MDO5032714.1 phosphate/phosphite/phosphonate ABC transporter substrate-binding protein [Corynebacterium sp.]
MLSRIRTASSTSSRTRLTASALLATALVSVPLLSACGSSSDEEAGDTLTFAAVPAESSQSLQSDYENIAKLIEQEAGVKVEFQNASDYAAVIEGQRAGKIDVASYGPFSYVIAKDSGVPIEAIASPTNDKEKAPAYTSLAYVTKDSDIASLADAKGKNVCFVDPGSTSGYLIPTKGLMDEGMDPEKDVTPVMAGGHDASLLTLKDGGCDIAFAHDAMLKTLEKSGQIEAGTLKSVWESDPITEDPIAINTSTVDEETAEKISTAIREKANKPALVEAGICTSEEECTLPEEIEWGYLPVKDSDFDAIRETCKVTNAEACKAVS